jgi:hypothetical protein
MSTRERFSLDGTWRLHTDPGGDLTPATLPSDGWHAVAVPAPWQSQSETLRRYSGAAWYEREFVLPAHWTGDCVLLHFGAVDYFAEVWLNGEKVSGAHGDRHEGGWLPFEIGVTAALRRGINRLTVRVDDPDELFAEVPHGKQSWYGPLSGVWQSVWLEQREVLHIAQVRVTPSATDEHITVDVTLSEPLGAARLCCEVVGPDGQVCAWGDSLNSHFTLPVPRPRLWSPDEPNLYRISVAVTTGRDAVQATFGFRTIEARNGMLLLNGQPLYLRAALDQDYYPDLIATPPSVEIIEREMRLAKEMGLNCLRVHIKVADPRYYEAADRAGLLVWTELPNWQMLTSTAAAQGRDTLRGIVERDWNHPSIVIWTIINESWGIDLTDPAQRRWLGEMYDWLKELDPLRLVVDNSACSGNAHIVTDIEDFHNYYAMPDHADQWDEWVAQVADRPWWTFAHEYTDYARAKAFFKDPWHTPERPPAPEVRRRGDEPIVVSEFGNWGLPDVAQLIENYGGKEPWWFESGHEWGGGVVYPHGIAERFHTFRLDRAFGTLDGLIKASQRSQVAALKHEIEEMRLKGSIQGYVITELTDVHWECNGLLDMQRNPKAITGELARFNADDVLIPRANRTAYWAGERVQVTLHISHYSGLDLKRSRIEWWLADRPQVHGTVRVADATRAGVTRAGSIRFTVPDLPEAASGTVHFRLVAASGCEAAQSQQELYFFPRRTAPPHGVRIYAPEIGATLAGLGYTVVERITDATLVVARTFTDELREYVLAGGRVLWLGEKDNARRTYLDGLQFKKREDGVWQGDWANSFSWLCKDRIFRNLPGDGSVDFMFKGITPEHVLTGLQGHEYATKVHAGLFVGWLHKTAGLIVRRRMGRGQFLASTFRLSRQLGPNPVATLMFDEMVAYLAGGMERKDGRNVSESGVPAVEPGPVRIQAPGGVLVR